jgi:carboxymethylenebutenolidase
MTDTLKQDGNAFNAFIAVPAEGNGAGVLVLHAWWGLNDFMRQTCEAFALAGYLAIAPDYYQGQIAETIEEAKACRGRIDRKVAQKEVTLALDTLSENPNLTTPKLAVVGFSLGAGYALEIARRRKSRVGALVLFYGTGGGKVDLIQAPIQGHFAQEDRWGANASKVDRLSQRLELAGNSPQFHTYPGTEHWFMESDRSEYAPEVADQAWKRTFEFLKSSLF